MKGRRAPAGAPRPAPDLGLLARLLLRAGRFGCGPRLSARCGRSPGGRGSRPPRRVATTAGRLFRRDLARGDLGAQGAVGDDVVAHLLVTLVAGVFEELVLLVARPIPP